MRKAIFADFYGTVVYENGPWSEEVVRRIYKAGNARRPEEIVQFWWKEYTGRLQTCVGENFCRQYDLALNCLEKGLAAFEAEEDAGELRELMTRHWNSPPVYDDAREFLERADAPVYFVTNSDDAFVEAAVKNLGFHPAGIITSEQARYAKPHREIFEYALKKLGLRPEEVVHIGDSLKGDVFCPASVGIRAVWLNREGRAVPGGVTAVKDLREASVLFSKERWK